MRNPFSKAGFTLIEINLAIVIMSTGVLVMCILYSLGYRENRQSLEDVASSAYAEAFFAPLVQGLSATNMAWSSWLQLGDEARGDAQSIIDAAWPQNGWSDYVQVLSDSGSDYRISSINPDTYYDKIIAKLPTPYRGSRPTMPSEYSYAFVMTRHGATIQLAFRCAQRRATLLTQPIFVTEVHFQGDQNR